MPKVPKILKWYQYISKFTPGSCRYYPTCSEYAKWLFENTDFATASLKSAVRIARCNQLFPGGIDYPTINYKPPKVTKLNNPLFGISKCNLPFSFNRFNSKLRIKYWFVPNGKNFYIIKDFDATATYLPARYASAPSPR